MPEPFPGKLSNETVKNLQNGGYIPKRRPTRQMQMIISCLTCPLRGNNEAYGYAVAKCTGLSPETVYPTLKRFNVSGALSEVTLRHSSQGGPQVVYTIDSEFSSAVTTSQSLPNCQERID